jgi:hypothetical protein
VTSWTADAMIVKPENAILYSLAILMSMGFYSGSERGSAELKRPSQWR